MLSKIDPANTLRLFGAFALCFLIGTQTLGFLTSPPDRDMGDLQKIMYVHVPTAWNALLGLTFAFLCAIVFLFRASWEWDARLEG